MKRTWLLLFILSIAAADALALTPHRSDRIGVLERRERFDSQREVAAAQAVADRLTRELRRRGFDAFAVSQNYDDLDRNGAENAEWYVEIVSSDSTRRSVGGIGIGDDNVGAEISVIVQRVAAGLRLYDGTSLELVDSFDLERRATAVVPTSIGIGGRHFYAYLALPLIEYARYRTAATEVARDAATRIERAVRPPEIPRD